jgi:hypothetical protein
MTFLFRYFEFGSTNPLHVLGQRNFEENNGNSEGSCGIVCSYEQTFAPMGKHLQRKGKIIQF